MTRRYLLILPGHEKRTAGSLRVSEMYVCGSRG